MKLVNVSGGSDAKYSVTFLCEDMADLLQLLTAAGGKSMIETLARMETTMATAAQKLAEIEKAIDDADAREAAEDEEKELTKAEVKRLTTELASLQEQLDAGTLTDEQEAKMNALIERIKASNVIPDQVLPGDHPDQTLPGDLPKRR